jgi:hypothetical protein
MRPTKLHDPGMRDDRRPAADSGDAITVAGGMSRTSSAVALAAEPAAPSTNLPTLRTVISNHWVLLAKVRRRNDALRNDNARMEQELAGRTQDGTTDNGAGRSHETSNSAAGQKLLWIGDYLRGTLAQTLWALDVRAARLEEQVAADDRQEARRVLELTHAAYDQLRSLMAELHDRADD